MAKQSSWLLTVAAETVTSEALISKPSVLAPSPPAFPAAEIQKLDAATAFQMADIQLSTLTFWITVVAVVPTEIAWAGEFKTVTSSKVPDPLNLEFF